MDSSQNQYAVSIPRGNIEQSITMPNDQAKCTAISKVKEWLSKNRSSNVKKLILLMSVAAVFWDPFFFYLPVVKFTPTCLGLDYNLRIIVVVFRSCVDLLHTFLWWHHPSSSFSEHRPILPWTVVILANLPLPQIVVFAVSWKLLTLRLVKFMVLIQLVIRLHRIIPAFKDATRSLDMLPIFPWFAAAFNLVMYTLASNILGALWYIRAVERNMDCWHRVCHDNENKTLCPASFYCDHTSRYIESLHMLCSKPQANDTKRYDYGIYEEAYETNIIKTDTPFLKKFFQCYWWGFRSLSSLGENLKTGTDIWDSMFVIFIALCGLVLFAFLIGNMQSYLQSKTTTAKLERMKQRKTYLEKWKPFSFLPDELKEEVMWCEEQKWQETTEVNLESLLNNTSPELSKKLREHFCKDMFSKIPEFKSLISQPRQKELFALAKPVVFLERSYIFNEGHPIYEVVFIVDGDLLSYNIQSGTPAEQHSADCFFEKELLQKLIHVAKQPQTSGEFSLDFPIASKTIRAMTKVEAFALPAMDLIKVFGSDNKSAPTI